jgi:Zn-finger domain-containing protein
VQVHRKVKELEAVRSNKRRDLFLAQDEVDARKETLISTIEARLQQNSTEEVLFRFRWRVE